MNKLDIIKKYSDKSKYDYCCSETLLHAVNDYYNFDLDDNAFRMVAAYCGGNLVGDTCGLFTTAISILGIKFTENVSHTSPLLSMYVKEFTILFNERFKDTNCLKLRSEYFIDGLGCKTLVYDTFDLLCEFIDSK